jgi:aspartyl/asparaginyl beta-hydroxylase (cupin superfamily)
MTDALVNEWPIEKLLRPIFRRKSLVGDSDYFNKKDFPVTKDLEENYEAILSELKPLMERVGEFAPFQDISPDQIHISNDDRWKMFFLKAGTYRFERNCRETPKTMEVLDRHKNIVSAYFSVIGPNKMLMPHEGPWCGVIRIHLAMVVPSDGDSILVCNEKEYRWKEGEAVVFDDTYEHFAVNLSNNNRVVLFLDYMRPLPKPWNWINWLILKSARLVPYFREPIKRHKEWEKSFYGLGESNAKLL